MLLQQHLILWQIPASAYFLHPRKRLGLLLVSSMLAELNYPMWSKVMIVALDAKNKLGFVYGTLPQPNTSDPLRAAWDQSVTPSQVQYHA